tara:strand:- start:7 stop:2112 length:2106 start_codon:yes stop_codon:yes gene_type:complete
MNLVQKCTNYPVADRIPHQVQFGFVDKTRGKNTMDPILTLEDNYYWLRDDTRKNKKVLQYLNDENNYTEYHMSKTKDLQNRLYKELLSHVEETYDSYPLPNSDNDFNSEYLYFTRTIKGKSYPLHCRINIFSKEIKILLDENEIAKGKTCCDISSFKITKDHKYISYGIDTSGNEKYKLKIFNIESGEELEHTLPELTYCDYSWYNNYIYYTVGDDQNRMYQIWRYNSITKIKQMIYENLDELVNVGYSVSNDNKYFFISADSYETSDIYYFTHTNLEVKQFTPKITNHKYTVDYHRGNFIIRTNKDNAKNFKLMICKEFNTNEENWKELLIYDESKYIKYIVEIKNYLLIGYKVNGHNLVTVMPFENNDYKINNCYDIQLDETIFNINVYFTNYNSNTIIFSQNSLKTPYSLYQLDLITKKSDILRVKPVPNYDKKLYETKRIEATSHDGTSVPISLVYRKDKFKKNGSNPLYLYGYGSYGSTVNPTFNSNILPLLDRGYVYAIAHVRGGSFLGFDWYENGKMEKKINTFHDFNSCAEQLITDGYTFTKGITIEGRSAGGLLVGACMNMRPDLYHTVIAGVPFVDVMNTMCDPTIPLTIPEWEQWGNPNIKKYFDLMLQYSPYDNIKDSDYPNMLALGGLNDPRVQYWEPAKFVAKTRHHNQGNSTILLKTEMVQGHFGGMDRYKYLRETAFSYAFVLSV